MDESKEQGHQLRALAMRVAALEDNVAFLERWCEEQQDALDRAVGPASYDYGFETGSEPPVRTVLRVVDLRDVAAAAEDDDGAEGDTDAIVALVETEQERAIRQLKRQLNRLRTRLAETLAPAADSELPEPPVRRRPEPRPAPVSAKQAGRTAP